MEVAGEELEAMPEKIKITTFLNLWLLMAFPFIGIFTFYYLEKFGKHAKIFIIVAALTICLGDKLFGELLNLLIDFVISIK